MTSVLTIVSPEPSQAGTLLALIRELAEYEKLDSCVVATESDIRDALFGAQPSCEAVLAFWGNEPVGFALYFSNFSTFLGRRGLYLEDLFVRATHRGRGIGLALMRHLGRVCIDRACGRFEWSVLDWNQSAIAFYESLGATPVSGWTVFRIEGDALAQLGNTDRGL